MKANAKEIKHPNYKMHHKYRFAFARMDDAMEDGWLMEAVTIQESIISARLLSVLSKGGINANPRDSFSSLIDRFRKHFEQLDAAVLGLAAELHAWRADRNFVLHCVCRDVDDPLMHDTVEAFEMKLVDTAEQGRRLVNEVRNTVSRIKRRLDS